MQLRVRDAAELFGVDEASVMDWVAERGLPAARIGQRFHFNRDELLEWATVRQVRFSSAVFARLVERDAPEEAGLAAALAIGGVHHDVPGEDQRAALAAVLERMPLPEDVDRLVMLEVLLARESLGSTGVGGGVAIPHVRHPVVLQVRAPLITLCFLRHPVAFQAPDGQPVHTLFTLVCPTVPSHLRLLSRLALGLHDPAFSQAVAARASLAGLVAAATALEARADAERAPVRRQ